MSKNYDESDIKVLEGLKAVRKRPGMYIGSTDSRGLHRLFYEILSNSIDEAINGFCKEITVTLKEDNSIEVSDDGRGIPYKKHETGKLTTEVIFTMLHSGGKFSEDAGYKTSGGLHGVGAAVVNALSLWVKLTIARDNEIFEQIFSNGGDKIGPLRKIGTSSKTGTTVNFKPDPSIFSTTIFQPEVIKERMREQAFLIKNVKLTYINEITKEKEKYQYEKGIEEYVNYLTEGKPEISKISYFNKDFSIPEKKKKIGVEIAFKFTDTYSETIYSYVNSIRTKDGGTHEIGFKTGLTKSINEYARKYGLIKEKEPNLDGSDIREGIYVVISIKLPEDLLQFESQTKDKLGSAEARSATEQIVYENSLFFLEENKIIASKIINRAIVAMRAREAARKARDEARSGKLKQKNDVVLSGKLTPATYKNKEINELYLVEGDSAGGSAKQGRDRKFQAILPLRGKVMNTEKTTSENLLKNEEIATMIYTIGADYGKNFDIKKCNYNKVIIMTDADTDGAHIQILLITFFFRYMKELIENGRLYVAQPPLYKVSYRKGGSDKVMYAWTDEELKILTKTLGNYNIQRFKGLGEMNASQLWETTMNPETRSLIRVTISDFDDSDKRVTTLMGSDVVPRREWIEKNIDFEVVDDFDITVK
jgi:topoisomerase-4 subunit B